MKKKKKTMFYCLKKNYFEDTKVTNLVKIPNFA